MTDVTLTGAWFPVLNPAYPGETCTVCGQALQRGYVIAKGATTDRPRLTIVAHPVCADKIKPGDTFPGFLNR